MYCWGLRLVGQRNNSQRKLCETGAQLFWEHGFGNVSIEALLQASGVARSTFYRFYRDKEELLVHIIEPMFEQATAMLVGIDAEQPGDIVNAIANSFLAMWKEQRYALLLSTSLGKALFPRVQPAHDQYAMAIYKLMECVNKVRLLRNDDPHLSAVILAQTCVKMMAACEKHPQFENVFTAHLRGLILKW